MPYNKIFYIIFVESEKKVEYKCCPHIRNGLNFTRTGLRFCNKLSASGQDSIVLYGKDFYKKFTQIKHSIIEDCKKGIIPDYCKGCIYLEEKDWDTLDEAKINNLEIFHWNQCNCACIYCGNRNETHLKITEKKGKSAYVDLYKILKSFIKEGHFAQNVNVSFVGGEPTLLKEFTDILKLFMKHKYKMHILTNGILYEKLFAKSIRLNKENYMTISLDCGSKEVFKQLKRVDKFDDVIKNIKRYIKDTKENSKNVIIKYILIEGVNDNREEIIKWLDLCKNIGVGTLHPTIEFCHSVPDPDKTGPSNEICELYEFMKEKIKEYGFNLNTYDFVEVIVKNKSYR